MTERSSRCRPKRSEYPHSARIAFNETAKPSTELPSEKVARARDDNSRTSARSSTDASDGLPIRPVSGEFLELEDEDFRSADDATLIKARGERSELAQRASEPARANLDPVLREEDRSITR